MKTVGIIVLILTIPAAAWGAYQVWFRPPLSRGELLGVLNAKYERLDLIVEYPFGRSAGAWVTLGGCVPSMTDARAARKWLYEQPRIAVVFDHTSFTPKDANTRYVDSACSSSYLHDGRQVAKWLLTPYRVDDPRTVKTLPLIKDADHRARVVDSLETIEDLETRGVHTLATALHEIHKNLHRWEPYHEDHGGRVGNLKMMFEVWAKMPAPLDECPGRGSGGHQDCRKVLPK